MTTKELRQVLDWADEGVLEANMYGTWQPYNSKRYIISTTEGFNVYRRKPTPTLRPWRPEEVPVGALIRRKFNSPRVAVILGTYIDNPDISNRIIVFPELDTCASWFLNDLATYHGGHNGDVMEHSLDHGKTWLPCGVVAD